jgi:hypothetical protein
MTPTTLLDSKRRYPQEASLSYGPNHLAGLPGFWGDVPLVERQLQVAQGRGVDDADGFLSDLELDTSDYRAIPLGMTTAGFDGRVRQNSEWQADRVD